MQKEYIEKEARVVGWIVGGVKLLGCIPERRSDPYSKGPGTQRSGAGRGGVSRGEGRSRAVQGGAPRGEGRGRAGRSTQRGGVGQSGQMGGAMPIMLQCL